MIYELERFPSTGNAKTDFLPGAPDNTGEAPKCPACHGVIGMREWLPPYRVELDVWGTSFGDIIIGTGLNVLVSERFASLWREEGLVGLAGFDPVEIVRIRRRGRTRETPPRYVRVSVIRSEAAIDQARSGMVWESPEVCDVCREDGMIKGWDRIVLEAPARENVFIARGLSSHILADERFRTFCEIHDIKNAHLIPGPDAGHWWY
jgi:hypothetical protein